MHALVIGTPKHQIPPEMLPGMVEGALAWHERYRDRFEAFGTFIGGGGFGVVNVADEQALNQMILELPFAFFSDMQVQPFVPGDAGLRQMQQALAAMSAGH